MKLMDWLRDFQFGEHQLVGPFFYATPLALKFEIGPAEEAETLPKKVYLDRAYARAVELLERASSAYDYVVLSLLRQEDRDIDTYLWHFTSKFNFNKCPEPELIEVEDWTGEVLVFERYLFPIADQDLKDLLWEIIKADHGGFQYFSGSVFFLSSSDKVIYHCYDDRGVDIAVVDDDKRRQLFTDCQDLLFDYDMEEMERRMES
ncbi:TPA: DUF3885 domain-containing protein [Streptococcus suis]|uniref:DUF3885 domain-containing protein n=1 Tax=Streptococcus suis TaxID=1307 RepID=A0A0Z8FUG2_STRSU|nr:DUF3885 domain-containing protein [Streptococcus suis]MCQ8272033.1 DUF3885 domain-containing protein [Streptococcus suis]MCQ8785288.1 DUF3885 domain-containing protein [Streptococcus suis]MCQ9225461.1 DUF3885 domain-containing protein [Streptococcus suis]MCQ9227735.1 DUF3885 domain-containing protein [Streptococcus suis]MCQ9241923.1 DUF3885 domain-containing protein [Streptococcus suis]